MQAESFLQEGLKVARLHEDKERMSDLFACLGWVVRHKGNYVQAESFLLEGLALARQIEQSERVCLLLSRLGAMTGDRGKYTQAKPTFKKGSLSHVK